MGGDKSLKDIECGCSSVVELHVANVVVAGSNPVIRSMYWGVAELADAPSCLDGVTRTCDVEVRILPLQPFLLNLF